MGKNITYLVPGYDAIVEYNRQETDVMMVCEALSDGNSRAKCVSDLVVGDKVCIDHEMKLDCCKGGCSAPAREISSIVDYVPPA